MRGSLAERFWAKVDVRGPDECWPWMASRSDGYGHVGERGRMLRANRVSLELALGRPLRPAMQALHTCDNPPCVNPAHLFEGTIADNVRDAMAKGRALVGAANHAALDLAVVRQIAADPGTNRSVAARFGVSRFTVKAIRHGRHWSQREAVNA